MRLGESGHAGELKVGFRQLARVHRCSEALVLVAAVNPAGGEAERVCGLMVMEQTFGDVKDVTFLDAHGAEPRHRDAATGIRSCAGPACRIQHPPR